MQLRRRSSAQRSFMWQNRSGPPSTAHQGRPGTLDTSNAPLLPSLPPSSSCSLSLSVFSSPLLRLNTKSMETRSPRKPSFVGPEATAAPSAPPSLPLAPLRNPDPPGIGDVVGTADDATAHRVTPMPDAPPLATRRSPTPLPSPLIHIWGPGAISTHIRRHVMIALMGAELASWLMTPTPRPIFSAHAHLPYGQARLVRYDPPPPPRP